MIPQPDIKPHPEIIGDYIVQKDFTYEWVKDGFRQKLIIPTGFDFDLASIPAILWSITKIAPDRLRWTAPLIHDFLYEYKGKLPKNSYKEWDKSLNGWVNNKDIWTRKNADRMFCRLMREDGIGWRHRRMAYRAVRAAGWYAWKT